jgi:hypothetical protein
MGRERNGTYLPSVDTMVYKHWVIIMGKGGGGYHTRVGQFVQK